MILRLVALIAALLGLAACDRAKAVWAPDEMVARYSFRAPGPAYLTLFTMVNNDTGEGEHAALLISGPERAIFDPAGSWYHPHAPERHDLHHGITDRVLEHYVDYHARVSHRVEMLTVEVAPEVAAQALALAAAAGPVAPSFCGIAVANILRALPGFESVPASYFPRRIAAGFAKIPGVRAEIVTSDDPAWNRDKLLVDPSAPPA